VIDLIKAHAYGNDFLFVPIAQTAEAEHATLARRMCDRHSGVGADGLVLYAPTASGATMTLYNADGGVAEVSGNAVRCLAAILVQGKTSAREVVIETDAGTIPLTLVGSAGDRMTFEALMGRPTGLGQRSLDVAGELVDNSDGLLGHEILDRRLDRPFVKGEHLLGLGRRIGSHITVGDGGIGGEAALFQVLLVVVWLVLGGQAELQPRQQLRAGKGVADEVLADIPQLRRPALLVCVPLAGVPTMVSDLGQIVG